MAPIKTPRPAHHAPDGASKNRLAATYSPTGSPQQYHPRGRA